MLLTIGMPCYDNPAEVWFTVQALRLYSGYDDFEILVLDNFGCEKTREIVEVNACMDNVRYERFTHVVGTGPARNALFGCARGDFVLCIDSHVLLWPDAVVKLKAWLQANWEEARNLIQGPIMFQSLSIGHDHFIDEWRSQMWGIWPPTVDEYDLPKEPTEIQIMGLGLFGCRKDSWLGFHKDCKGFDGVEGVLHEKYRRAGRKVLSLPFLRWCHYFGAKHTYPNHTEDKIRNFLLGFKEIGLDPEPIYEHFGYHMVKRTAQQL